MNFYRIFQEKNQISEEVNRDNKHDKYYQGDRDKDKNKINLRNEQNGQENYENEKNYFLLEKSYSIEKIKSKFLKSLNNMYFWYRYKYGLIFDKKAKRIVIIKF